MGGKKRRRKGREEKGRGEEETMPPLAPSQFDIPRKSRSRRPWYLLFTSINFVFYIFVNRDNKFD